VARQLPDPEGRVIRLPRARDEVFARRNTMNVHAPRHFVPPRPDIPEKSVNWYGFLRALRTNALQIWPREAYAKDVLEQSFFRRKRFLLNAPDGIHRVLVDNIATNGGTSAAPSHRRLRHASSRCWRATSSRSPTLP
jgi:hypothetical protein